VKVICAKAGKCLAYSPATWSYPDSLGPVMKCWKKWY